MTTPYLPMVPPTPERVNYEIAWDRFYSARLNGVVSRSKLWRLERNVKTAERALDKSISKKP